METKDMGGEWIDIDCNEYPNISGYERDLEMIFPISTKILNCSYATMKSKKGMIRVFKVTSRKISTFDKLDEQWFFINYGEHKRQVVERLLKTQEYDNEENRGLLVILKLVQIRIYN